MITKEELKCLEEKLSEMSIEDISYALSQQIWGEKKRLYVERHLSNRMHGKAVGANNKVEESSITIKLLTQIRANLVKIRQKLGG